MFRLLRYFSITSMIAFIIVILLLGWIYNEVATNSLIELEASKNSALAQAIANSILPQFQPLMTQTSGLSVDDLRTRPETTQIRAAILKQMTGQSIIKVKIYNLDGLTVFSTEPAQIGEDKSDNLGYQSALTGLVASELTHRDTFSAFEQTIEDRDVVSSYIPIYAINSSGEIEGVFEIYSDVTSLLSQIQYVERTLIMGVTGILILLYIALFLIVRRANGIIRQQARELRTAKELAESANLAKTQFISFVAHELRNPITSIRGYVDLLKRGAGGDVTEKQSSFLEVINHNAHRMTLLASDLNDISRIETGELKLHTQPVILGLLVTEVIQSLQLIIAEKEQKLSVHMPNDLPSIQADRGRLEQILTNLLSNAHKYTPPAGSITIEGCVVINKQQPFVQVAIHDTGYGIPLSDQKMIFQRFFRVKNEQTKDISGSGLGLNITHQLIEMQGGRIWFESVPQKGTSFYFTLPAASDSSNRNKPSGYSGGASSF